MEDSMKNFREASNLVLENIYVTDELKRKTLEKCTHRKESIMNVKLTAAFSGALIIFVGIFISLFHNQAINNNNIAKSINQKQKNSLDNESKIQEAAKTTGSSDLGKHSPADSNSEINIKNNVAISEKKNVDIAMKGSNNIPKNKTIDAVKENIETDSQSKNDSSKASDSIFQNRDDISDREMNTEAQSDTNLALVPEALTIEKAEEYFESKILIPYYIPEGFTLTDISIPDENEKCVKLKYSSSSADFEILQSKNLSELSGTESVSIGNNTTYIDAMKDEKTNVVTTKITWIIGDVQYSVSSTLPEDSLIKIAESIND
ncbi:DUF4367 domain-containing protein [Clostridium sp. BSD9I1]|uniref:DUF4367 domain-containing protein n=1 Tax=Clostridium sp. BSD9I1 TaxID=2003589 RepID=UPI001646D54E|nr:DUF4367 domain-containing protein [Clostridium sp. BSD9I1]